LQNLLEGATFQGPEKRVKVKASKSLNLNASVRKMFPIDD